MKSFITYLVLTVTLIIFSFTYYPKYQKSGSEATISWDVSGYYWYLPATFIYKDLKNLTFSDSIRAKYGCSPDNQQITILPDGKKVLKYSSGMAVQYLPFFIGANILAKPLGYAQDGFSKPYQIALQIGAIVMMLLGLWSLRKLLLRYYTDGVVALVLFLITIGTNYLNYAMIDVGMSHAWLFAWYCILMYATDSFYKKPSKKLAIIIGFILGLLMLSRPTEFIAVIIPLVWGISRISMDEIKNRIQFIFAHISLYFIAGLTTIVVGSIQLFYWKYATGHWLVYSYGDQHFSFLHPHTIDYIFSFRCGWLLYCPLMILPYLGFVFLFKQKISFIPLFLYAILNLWIVSSWDIWWYGGRAMIQGYAVLCFPLASLISFVHQKNIFKIIFYPIILFLVYLNIWWVHGVHLGGYMMIDNVTKAYYFRTFPFMKKNNMDRRLLDTDEDFREIKKDSVLLLQQSFSQDTSAGFKENDINYLYIPAQTAFSKEFEITNPYNKKWVRFSAKVICKQQNWDEWRMTFMGIKFMNGNETIKNKSIKIDRLFYDENTLTIYIDTKIPAEKFTKIIPYFYQEANTNGVFLIEEVNVEAFN